MAGLNAVFCEATGAGKIKRGLGNIVARVGFDGMRLKSSRCSAVLCGADQHAVTAGLAHCFDHQLVEILAGQYLRCFGSVIR